MASKLLLAVVPTVVTAATAVAVWLCRQGAQTGGDGGGGGPTLVPPSASLASSCPDELSLVTYNVLADAFAAKLDYAAPEQLDWHSARWPRLQAQLRTWRADVVLLQEVDVAWCVCACVWQGRVVPLCLCGAVGGHTRRALAAVPRCGGNQPTIVPATPSARNAVPTRALRASGALLHHATHPHTHTPTHPAQAAGLAGVC
jgi:hypothetical protein